jgi:hypothetical protein
VDRSTQLFFATNNYTADTADEAVKVCEDAKAKEGPVWPPGYSFSTCSCEDGD